MIVFSAIWQQYLSHINQPEEQYRGMHDQGGAEFAQTTAEILFCDVSKCSRRTRTAIPVISMYFQATIIWHLISPCIFVFFAMSSITTEFFSRWTAISRKEQIFIKIWLKSCWNIAKIQISYVCRTIVSRRVRKTHFKNVLCTDNELFSTPNTYRLHL